MLGRCAGLVPVKNVGGQARLMTRREAGVFYSVVGISYFGATVAALVQGYLLLAAVLAVGLVIGGSTQRWLNRLVTNGLALLALLAGAYLSAILIGVVGQAAVEIMGHTVQRRYRARSTADE
jgi:hypothetical protein